LIVSICIILNKSGKNKNKFYKNGWNLHPIPLIKSQPPSINSNLNNIQLSTSTTMNKINVFKINKNKKTIQMINNKNNKKLKLKLFKKIPLNFKKHHIKEPKSKFGKSIHYSHAYLDFYYIRSFIIIFTYE
jgi:hypothetical protein